MFGVETNPTSRTANENPFPRVSSFGIFSSRGSLTSYAPFLSPAGIKVDWLGKITPHPPLTGGLPYAWKEPNYRSLCCKASSGGVEADALESNVVFVPVQMFSRSTARGSPCLEEQHR